MRKVLGFKEIKNHCFKPISKTRFFFPLILITVYLAMVFTLPRVTDLFENLLKATQPCPHLGATRWGRASRTPWDKQQSQRVATCFGEAALSTGQNPPKA